MTLEDDFKLDIELRMSVGAAEAMGKKILFPDRHLFNELFLDAIIIPDFSLGKYTSNKVHSWPLDSNGFAHLSSFCPVRANKGGSPLDVTPKVEVIKAIENNMLLSNDYTINFSIIVRDNGTSLLIAQYDKILGDRWLAILATRSIPGMEEHQHA